MAKKQKVLNLDELFSNSQPIKVVYQKKSYEFSRPIDLTPSQLSKFEKLSKKMVSLGDLEKAPDEYTEEDADFVEGVLDDLIVTICEDFPVKDLPFMAKVYLISNYQDEIAAEEDDPKVDAETMKD